MNKNIFNAILRQDLKSFVVKVFNEISPNDKFLDNWHIDVICYALQNMINNQNNRLIVNIPPRYMKSIICSVALPAFLLGINPKVNIICVSYSDDLSSKFANDCLHILQTKWYQDLFPNTILNARRRSIDDFETTAGGGRMATSIGGTLTGRGADWLIIDDPLKPSDAVSDTQREKVNDWYRSTLYSRLNDKNNGKILLIMQRLHQNDLSGYLLSSMSSFQHLCLPVLAEKDEKWRIYSPFSQKEREFIRKKGEPLHSAREGIQTIEDLRKSLGVYSFAGQYMQRPVPLEGGLIKENWLHYYNIVPQRFKKIILSWDTASKTGETNAYSALVVLGVDADKKILILNCYRDRLEFPDLIRKVVQIHLKTKNLYPMAKVETLIEEASSGIQAIQQIRANYGELKIVSIKPIQDKMSRLAGISSYIENGMCLFPQNKEAWWKDFRDELLTFPASTFKDQCDALSQGIEYATTTKQIYFNCI